MDTLTGSCKGGALRLMAATVAVGFLLSATLPSAAVADPPPWAPAHGWRAKHKHKKHGHGPIYIVQPYPYYVRPQPYAVPFGIELGRCNRDLVGAAIGGVAGGAIGAGVTDRDDRVVGIVAGTVIGAVVGGLIGDSMDRADYTCMGQSFEYARPGQPVSWTDPNGDSYRVVPGDNYESNGRYCREYTTSAVIDGRVETVAGTACRRPDGSWDLSS
jgi:surface antigen